MFKIVQETRESLEIERDRRKRECGIERKRECGIERKRECGIERKRERGIERDRSRRESVE